MVRRIFMENKAYTFVKNVKGSLAFPLESYNMQLPTKWFTIPANAERIIVPFPYALGLFITDETLKQYENGYFSILDYDSLKAAAEEVGFLPREKVEKVYSAKEIEEALLKGNAETIKTILNEGGIAAIDTLLVIAREKFDQLNNGVTRTITETCGVELEIE